MMTMIKIIFFKVALGYCNRSETPLTAATQPDQDEPLFAVR